MTTVGGMGIPHINIRLFSDSVPGLLLLELRLTFFISLNLSNYSHSDFLASLPYNVKLLW